MRARSTNFSRASVVDFWQKDDAGYEEAKQFTEKERVNIPMAMP